MRGYVHFQRERREAVVRRFRDVVLAVDERRILRTHERELDALGRTASPAPSAPPALRFIRNVPCRFNTRLASEGNVAPPTVELMLMLEMFVACCRDPERHLHQPALPCLRDRSRAPSRGRQLLDVALLVHRERERRGRRCSRQVELVQPRRDLPDGGRRDADRRGEPIASAFRM
jgi:hypothetical protein